MDGLEDYFPFGMAPIFGGYVSFRERTSFFVVKELNEKGVDAEFNYYWLSLFNTGCKKN